MFSSLCVVSLWRNNTFSMHMLTTKDQWVMLAKPPSRKVSVCRLVFFTRITVPQKGYAKRGSKLYQKFVRRPRPPRCKSEKGWNLYIFWDW